MLTQATARIKFFNCLEAFPLIVETFFNKAVPVQASDCVRTHTLAISVLPCTRDKQQIKRKPKKNVISVKSFRSPVTKIATVDFNHMPLTIGLNFNDYSRKSTILTPLLKDQIIGHLLGDGCFTKGKTENFPHFQFTQSYAKKEYVFYAFINLAYLCLSFPFYSSSFRNGTLTKQLLIKTRSYPFFFYMYERFYIYKDNNIKKRTKIIPRDILLDLNPRVLAFWAMDTGVFIKNYSEFILHPYGFSFEDVYLLISAMTYTFELDFSIINRKGKPIVFIQSQSMHKFINLIFPYLHLSASLTYGVGQYNKIKILKLGPCAAERKTNLVSLPYFSSNIKFKADSPVFVIQLPTRTEISTTHISPMTPCGRAGSDRTLWGAYAPLWGGRAFKLITLVLIFLLCMLFER